jgi:hypothetical protein
MERKGLCLFTSWPPHEESGHLRLPPKDPPITYILESLSVYFMYLHSPKLAILFSLYCSPTLQKNYCVREPSFRAAIFFSAESSAELLSHYTKYRHRPAG